MCSDILRDQIKIPHQVFEIIEELRSRRIKDAENEVKLDNMLKNKIELTNKVDDLNMKIKLLEAESLSKIEELQTSSVSQSTQKEEMVRRQKLIIETNEKEIKNLRDEICKYQLINFSLERKTNDQEKKLSLQSSILDAFTKQKSKFESCLKACKEESKDIETTIDKLKSEVDDCKKNMKNYQELNNQLSNEIQSLKSGIKSLHSQLTFANAKNARLNLLEETYVNHVSSGQVHREEIHFLKETNKRLVEKADHFEKELNDMQNIFIKSQLFLETQTSSYEKCINKISELESKLNCSEEQCRMQVNDIERYRSAVETSEIKHRQIIEGLLSEKSELEAKLMYINNENNELKLAIMDLEELNAKWASKNLELVDLISPEYDLSQTIETNENYKQDQAVMENSIRDAGDKGVVLNKTEQVTIDKAELLEDVDNCCECLTANDDTHPKHISSSDSCDHTVPKLSIVPETSQQTTKENQDDVTAIYKKLIQSSLTNNLTSLRNKVTSISSCTSKVTENNDKRSASPLSNESIGNLKYPRLGESSDDHGLVMNNLDDDLTFDNVVRYIVNSDNN